jgi:methionyl-tRNA formyltransferase
MMNERSTAIIFMGTPLFAVPSLRALLEAGHHVAAVVTQPDRPVGRKRVLTPTPVKEEALKHNLPVLQPAKLRNADAVAQLAAFQPDLIVTAAYGQILPKSVLDIPKYGCVNVHGSLLPKYRGGAPIQRSIMLGETITGVTLMHMAEGLDTGDIINFVQLPIAPEADAGSMFHALSEAGAALLLQTLPAIFSGTAPRIPQNPDEASYAPNLSRDDERIEWDRPALHIYNQIRGLSPQPGAFTLWNGEVFKIWKARLPDPTETTSVAPGTVLAITDDSLAIATGEGVLRATVVQPAGKKVLTVAELNRNGQLKPNVVLGEHMGGNV